MASYLGKISAIVSANTAGYVRSLNDAAAQTRDFAKTIRSDITRSSNDASKAFNSILSPLQKLQRALDAASSQRLSFKGVEGAINNVKQLRQQINEIRDLQLAVRITGADGIDDLRENLLSLSSTDIQAAVRVTGSEDVEQLQRRLNRFSDRTVNLLARAAGVENIDQLAEKVDSLSDRELRLSVRAINENAIERAKRQLEQLTSASAEIATPLAAANRQLTGFAAEIQAALLPGFSQVQKAALQLEQDIRSGAEIGEERYTRLRDTVERTAAAVAAVGELDLGSGAEIQQFQQQLQAVNETAIEIAGRQLQIEIGSEEVASVRDEISRLQEELTGVRSGETRLRVSAEEAVEAKRAIDRLAASRDEIQVRVEADASELRRIDAEIEAIAATIEVNVETEGASEARQQLESLRRQREEQAALFESQTAELNRLEAAAEEAGRAIDRMTEAAAKADREIADLSAKIDAIERGASTEVDIDTTEGQRRLDELRRQLEEIQAERALGISFGSATGREVGEFSNISLQADGVRIDRSGTRRRLRDLDAEIAQAESRLAVEVPVTVDAEAARAQLESLRQQRVEIEARVTADRDGLTAVTAELDQAKQRLEAAPAEVRLAADFVDLTRQINEAKQQIRDLANNRVGVELDATEALAEINLLENQVESLEGRRATIRASFDDDARREADQLISEIDALNARQIQIEADIKVNDEDLQRGFRLLSQAEGSADLTQFNRESQALGRRIANGFLNVITPAEAAADTVAAQSQALGRKIANGFLNVLSPAEANVDALPGARTDLQPDTLQRSAERAAREQIGAGIDPVFRQFDRLAQRVQGLRGQIDSLPATIGSEFIPQLQRAEQEFIRLRSSGRATAEEIENASNNVEQLAAQVRRVGAAQGLGSFADGLDDTALRGAIGNLQALQQILNRVGATAGSDGARQFDRLRAAIQRATREGTVGSEAFQRELEQITQEAAKAAAATGKIGRSAAFREIKRGGDIARGGFDKLSLATQQAAFAIDDFFSATGDFTQKIRAVQNNVTQLAFILGGTTGLFIGLGVAIAAQAAVALFKWANGTVDAEDKTQALNDALARQKSLVEELKQAFDSLGDSLTRGIFDEATERARELESQIDTILQKSREQLNEQAVSLDPVVQRERQVQAARQRQLDQTTDIPTRISLQRDIDQSRERERRAAEEAAARSFDPLAAQQSLRDLLVDIGRGRALDRSNQRQGGLPLSDAERERIERSRQRVDDFQGAADAFSRRDILTSERNALLDRRATPNIGQNERAAIDRALVVVESLLGDLERPLEEARVKLRVSLLQSSDGIRESLERSAFILRDSLGGFGPLAAEQRALSKEFNRITSELAAGATAGVDGVLGTDDDIALTREAIEARKEELQRIRELVDGNLSAVRSTEAFSNALDRLAGDLADTVLGEAQSAEQQARRDVNRRQAELNTLPADATPRERLDATASLRDAQQRQAELAASADDIAARRRQLAGRQAFEVEQFQQQARAGNLGDDLQRQIRARDAIQGRIDAGQNVASDERARLAELTASIADAFENSLAGVQLAAEADALDVRRQEVDAGFQRSQQQAEERQRSVDSGLELIQSPEQTAAQRGLDQFNEAINGALSLVANELNSIAPNLPQLDDGLISLQELGTLFSQFPNQIGGIREQFLANLQQARDNITGNISAQIAQFDVERSRPSRQALQAQDINTQQGRAELNRLLRGDDANRDQPILQGIKEQTAILKLIDQRIDEVNRVVGVAGV